MRAAIAFVWILSVEAAAQPVDIKQRCASAYEEGQKLRKSGKLSEARDRLLFCAQDVCPAVVRKDCTMWLADVEQIAPTVILIANNSEGKDLVDVRVIIDGKPVMEKLDGKTMTMDPGPHTLRFEAPGFVAFEEQVLIREGEKGRRIVARLAREAPVAPPPAPPTTHATETEAPPIKKPAPAAAWVLAGLGVVGLGTFGFFAVRGAGKEDELQSCTPRCSPRRLNEVKNNYLIADIGLGVGLVSLATAAILYLARGNVPRPANVTVGVNPLPGGGAASVGGTF